MHDTTMRVLVFHGYLLGGTGSNVYNAELVRALAGLGHEVHILCQDHEAASYPWVDAVGRWDGERFHAEPTGGSSPGEGSVTAYQPDIGGLLPVYVADRYEGFRVKTFSELSEEELDGYIDANVTAVRAVAEGAGGIDAALSNHLVMGPLILARAGVSAYASKVHGSALSYTVIPDHRFLPHAREGMRGASGVLVGSRHTAESLWETLEDPDLPGKTRLGPPGVDIEGFRRPRGGDPAAEILALAGKLRDLAEAQGGAEPDPDDSFARDPGEAADALERFAAAEGPRVIFVGKTIVSKGCDLLLSAWPAVVAANPGARLLMVGFGAYREGLEELWAAISSGDLEAARALAAQGWGREGGEERPLPILSAWLADPPADWAETGVAAAGSVDFSGRLEHTEVGDLLPATDAMVVPSTFPEAFGMVAAEAAAAGAMPVCADHSGLAEVAAALDERLPEAAKGLTAFPLDPGAVEGISSRLNRWLALSASDQEAARASLAETVAHLWSWQGVARGVIAASAGELDGLPKVPGSPAA